LSLASRAKNKIHGATEAYADERKITDFPRVSILKYPINSGKLKIRAELICHLFEPIVQPMGSIKLLIICITIIFDEFKRKTVKM